MSSLRPGASRAIAAALALGALGLAALAPPLAAQNAPCDARESIVAMLEERYGEQHRASGLATDTSMIEIWVSDESGTWTVLLTSADGTSCIAAAGGHWVEEEPTRDVLH